MPILLGVAFHIESVNSIKRNDFSQYESIRAFNLLSVDDAVPNRTVSRKRLLINFIYSTICALYV